MTAPAAAARRLVAVASRVVSATPWDGRARRLLYVLLAVAVFALVAESVLLRERGEGVTTLDRTVRAEFRRAAADPALKTTAVIVSRLTGEGLAVIVAAGTLALFLARRRAEGVTVLLGTLSAWIASGLLKLAYGIPRPRARDPFDPFVSYGFPSGHTMVTLVACGLLAWAVGRRAPRPVRVAFVVAVAVISILSGAARMVLDAHWLSDVVAGLALGTVWLNAILALAAARR
ncbi:MAG TPA: phosphatase PAP2 family protein [Methylomirabilota bacterium]